MEVLRDTDGFTAPYAGMAVTIGAYDGVHCGHRAVIGQVRERAHREGLRTAVVTFDRHPASVVRPASAPLLLTDLDQKLELLASTGVDYTVVIAFDDVRSKEPAEDFVRDLLVRSLGAKVVVVGEDFHFGHRRSGNVAVLEALGVELGFAVRGINLVGTDGTPAVAAEQVSSTRIRRALHDADLVTANRLLGRLHEVRGVVVDGDKRARHLGFRTANVNVPRSICVPADGIYAGYTELPSGERVPTAISLGRRPTYYDDQPYSLLEAHLLDWEGDLYGTSVRVAFHTFLRGERKFDGPTWEADLIAQIDRDCHDARVALQVG